MNALKTIAELSFGKIIIMAALATLAYYTSYFDPGEEIEKNIVNVQGAIDEEEAKKTEITKTMKKEEEMRGNSLQLQRNLENIKSKIPSDFTDSQMQLLINESAANSGCSLQTLTAAGKATDPNAKPQELRRDQVRPENLIAEVIFKIQLTGTFEAFLKFLDTLAKEDKVIKIRNFQITRASESVEEDKIRFVGEVVGFKQANIVIVDGGR